MVVALRIVGSLLVVLATALLFVSSRGLHSADGQSAVFIDWSEWLTIALWAMLAIGSLAVVASLFIKPKTRS